MFVVTEQITGYGHFVLADAKRVSGKIAGYSPVDKHVQLLITWTGLWSGKIGFIIVLLNELLRVF